MSVITQKRYVLVPEQGAARRLRKLQEAHYASCGDFSPWALPPVFDLGRFDSAKLMRRTLAAKAVFSSSRIAENDLGWLLLPENPSPFEELKKELGLPGGPSGLFFSWEKPVGQEFTLEVKSFRLAVLTIWEDGSSSLER